MSSCRSPRPVVVVWSDVLDQHTTAQPLCPLRDTGKTLWYETFFQNESTSTSFNACAFLSCSGGVHVPAGLPEQYGLCLATAQLHWGRPRGEHTAADTQPPRFLWRISEELELLRVRDAGLSKTEDTLALCGVTPKHNMFSRQTERDEWKNEGNKETFYIKQRLQQWNCWFFLWRDQTHNQLFSISGDKKHNCRTVFCIYLSVNENSKMSQGMNEKLQCVIFYFHVLSLIFI